MSKVYLLLTFGLVAFLIGCGDGGEGSSSGKRRVVATIAMVGDVASQIAGDRLEVVTLIPTGSDPHVYNPNRDDVERLRTADLILYVGLHLEGKMADTLKAAHRDKRPAVAVGERLDPAKLIGVGGDDHDPHVWMDVALWSEAAGSIADELAKLDPANADAYRANAAAYRERLSQLHAYGRRVLATVPAERRVLVTSHDAFNYFGRAYGVEVEGVQGISTESEAGLARVNELVSMLVSRKVAAVFVESSVDPKYIRALIEGANSRGADVKVGGELFSDAMGEAGTYEGTYVGMLDHNLTLVARALGGEAPEAGFEGKLTRK